MAQPLQEGADTNTSMKNDEASPNLLDELTFISPSSPSETRTTNNEKKVTASDCDTKGDLANELSFISQPSSSSSSSSIKKDANDTTRTRTHTHTHTHADDKNGNLVDELTFISQPSATTTPEENTEKASMDDDDKGQKEIVDELKFISQLSTSTSTSTSTKRKNGEKIGTNGTSSSSTQPKKRKVKFENGGATSETKRQEPSASSSNPPTPTERKNPSSPLKHMLAFVVFSIMAILMTFAYLRIGLRVFCPYDEQNDSYTVMELVSQCPVPIQQDNDDDDNDDDNKPFVPFWKKRERDEAEKEELFDHVPAPPKEIHEILCRGTFNILHLGAALLHPNINYKITMPQVYIHSPCPEIPKRKKKKKNPVEKVVSGIVGIFQKNKKKKKELVPPLALPPAPVKEPESSDGGSIEKFDWTLFVSTPLDLDLSSQQLDLARKLTENLKTSLAEDDPVLSQEQGWFEERMDQVPFGGTFSWWFPNKDHWSEEQEDHGLRLVAAFMKIMEWPEVRLVNGSRLDSHDFILLLRTYV